MFEIVTDGRNPIMPSNLTSLFIINKGRVEANNAVKVQDHDIDAAKALMAEAGHGDGLSIRLNCPSDRCINDEAICQAAVGMLAQTGVTVALEALPRPSTSR